MGVRHAVLILMLLAAGRADRVSIRSIVPAASLVNGTARLTCAVPRHSDNRWLVMGAYYEGGIVYQSSMRQLDADAAPMTHVLYLEHLPCDVDTLRCDLYAVTGEQFHAVRPFLVSGCAS